MKENNTIQEVFDTLNDKQKKLIYTFVGYVIKTRRMPTILIDYETGYNLDKLDNHPLVIRILFNTFTDTQKQCVDAIVRDVYKRVNIAFMVEED